MRNEIAYEPFLGNAALFIAVLFFAVSLHAANKQVRITVHAGASHKFEGLGASTNNRRNYQQLPEGTRKELAALMWGPREMGGMDFRALRLWARSTDDDGGVDFNIRYKQYYEDVKELQQDKLKILLGPTGDIGDFDAHAEHYAKLIRDVEAKYGFKVDYTGLANEPNAHDSFSPEATPLVIKAFRRQLDNYNLQHVKIIGPETSNVDWITFAMFDNIIADAEALEILDGFSTHSYNMCLLYNEIYLKVKPFGKEYWQTESSANGAEDFNDSIRASNALSRCISDINLGVNVWIWFLGYEKFDPYDNATRIMGYDITKGTYGAFLKHYYFRQFSRTLYPGSDIYLCESNLHEMEPNGRDTRDRWMENWYGLKPPLCAVAGRNPANEDAEEALGSCTGDWAAAIANTTGIYSDWAGSYYYPKATYDVTFFFEELAGQSGKKFQVMRCNDGARNVFLDDVVMKNGEITVTVHPMDIVSVRENSIDANWKEPAVFAEEEDFGYCGVGVGFAFIPPMGISGLGMLRRMRRRKKRVR